MEVLLPYIERLPNKDNVFVHRDLWLSIGVSALPSMLPPQVNIPTVGAQADHNHLYRPFDMMSPNPNESMSASTAVEKNSEYYFTDLFIQVSGYHVAMGFIDQQVSG